MASVKFKRGDVEFEIMSEYWKLMEAHYIPENSQEYWTKTIDAVNAFAKKYDKYPLARRLAIALMDYLDEVYHDGNG